MRPLPAIWMRVSENRGAFFIAAHELRSRGLFFASRGSKGVPMHTSEKASTRRRRKEPASVRFQLCNANFNRSSVVSSFFASGVDWTNPHGQTTPRGSQALAPLGAGVTDLEGELRDLMIQGLAGDAGAYRRLLKCLGDRFRYFFQSKMKYGETSYIEDLVQETLMAIHMRRDTYDVSQPLTPWIYAIARYKMIDYFRRVKSRGVSIPVDDVAELFSSDRADSADAARDVGALLHRLSPKQRTAIELVKLQELSIGEAAARSGMSEADIKVSIHRGLKKLSAFVAKGERK